MRGRSRGHQQGKQVPSFVPPASSISLPLLVMGSAPSAVSHGSPPDVPRLRIEALPSRISVFRLGWLLRVWTVFCSSLSLLSPFCPFLSSDHSAVSREGACPPSRQLENAEGRSSAQCSLITTLTKGTAACGNTIIGGRLLAHRLSLFRDWLEGLRQCAEALWDLSIVIALSLWRVLSLQFCPRRREYLVHAQGIAAVARLALERERDDDRALGLDYNSGPISYTTSLIDNTFFPPLPGFGGTPSSPAAVSPFSTHAAAGLWASLSSLWPDIDPDDYGGSPVTRLAAVLGVWADSFRQLGTLLQLSGDLETGSRTKKNLFFGVRANLAVSAVEAFGDRAAADSLERDRRCGDLPRNSAQGGGVFSRLLTWCCTLWPFRRTVECGAVGPAALQPASAAGLFPYLLWWRWWPAAAAAAIPRSSCRNGSLTYSSPCFFPGIGRCADAGCGPTSSNVEDYWEYARIVTAADHNTRESLEGSGSESASGLSACEFADIRSQPGPRPIFSPFFFSPDFFPSVFGGWLFPVTGNPTFAALPFFRVLWWPAAVAAAGGGSCSPWRLSPYASPLTSSGCEVTSQQHQQQRFSLHAQERGYSDGRTNSNSSACRQSSSRTEEDGVSGRPHQRATGKWFSSGGGEDGQNVSASQLRCLDFSLSSLAGGPPPIFCVNPMQEAGSSASAPQYQGSGNRKNSCPPSGHKATPRRASSQEEDGELFLARFLSKICPGGASGLLVEPCRFCALNLRADIKPPPASFVAPPPAFLPRCITRTMQFLCTPGKSGEDKCSPDDSAHNSNSSSSSSSSSPPHKSRSRHSASGASTSSVPGPHILFPETLSGTASRGGDDVNGFFYYASPTRRCTCVVLLPQRAGASVAVSRVSTDGFFVPLSTVRTRGQHGPSPPVGATHTTRKQQVRGGGGNTGSVQKGSGGGPHAASGLTGTAEAAAKNALEQKHRLAHLPVHLHAVHCILGLTGVPATAAAVDEAYCRQLVLVGDPPAMTQGGSSNCSGSTKSRAGGAAAAGSDLISSGAASREEAEVDVQSGEKVSGFGIRGRSSINGGGWGRDDDCPARKTVSSFSNLLQGVPVESAVEDAGFGEGDDRMEDSLLSGSFGSAVRGSWRREYVFKRVVNDSLEGFSITSSSSSSANSDGGGRPSWGNGTRQPALPTYEDFCDLLGVLHRARTAAQLFLALNRYPGACGSVTHPGLGQISPTTTNVAASGAPEEGDGKKKATDSSSRNCARDEGGCSDLWSSCLFVPGPSAFSFAIHKRGAGGKAGAGELTACRGQEATGEEGEGEGGPGAPTGSCEEGGGRSSTSSSFLQTSGAAGTSIYLRRRREDAQRIVQAFLLAFFFARLRLQAAVGKFVTRKEGPCSQKQANQLREMLRLSSDWIRTGGGGGKFATSLLTAQEDDSKYTCPGPPKQLPPCLEYEYSAHPVAVAVRERLLLLLRLLLLDPSPARVFERWKGRTPCYGEEPDSDGAEDAKKSRFDLLRQPWMFDRGYSILVSDKDVVTPRSSLVTVPTRRCPSARVLYPIEGVAKQVVAHVWRPARKAVRAQLSDVCKVQDFLFDSEVGVVAFSCFCILVSVEWPLSPSDACAGTVEWGWVLQVILVC